MLDFLVDNLDAVVARLTANGVKILQRDDTDPSGRFAWIVDPDGTKIELWQAKPRRFLRTPLIARIRVNSG
jgi:predicted enzyme related to lactoylglutathione lyase